jgi:hypothetical protein
MGEEIQSRLDYDSIVADAPSGTTSPVTRVEVRNIDWGISDNERIKLNVK